MARIIHQNLDCACFMVLMLFNDDLENAKQAHLCPKTWPAVIILVTNETIDVVDDLVWSSCQCQLMASSKLKE